MYNCTLIKLKHISDEAGNLIPVEEQIDIPFKLKRIYYIYGVSEKIIRGNHAHKKLHQVLICMKGSVKIRVKTPKEEEIFELNDPSVGLYTGTMIWREMFDFSKDAVLVVLASEHYDENDYIRNYNYYLEEAKNIFGK